MYIIIKGKAGEGKTRLANTIKAILNLTDKTVHVIESGEKLPVNCACDIKIFIHQE